MIIKPVIELSDPIRSNIEADRKPNNCLNTSDEKIAALHNHITVIKDQIESLLNQEDEQLTTVYGFLTQNEQEEYFAFLVKLDEAVKRYILMK